jgi:hypothetical protein
VFQRGEIGSIGERVALVEDLEDFPRLPVDNARQDQVKTTAGVHLPVFEWNWPRFSLSKVTLHGNFQTVA